MLSWLLMDSTYPYIDKLAAFELNVSFSIPT